jgi:diguanylate cyclase (GGDEF)-like protein
VTKKCAQLPKDRKSRRSTESGRRFDPRIFVIASLVAAAILGSIVAVPQWLSKQARWEALRANVGDIAGLAASVIDGDLHHKLLDAANYSDELYQRALKPLVRFHSADPEIHYLYTMVERNGKTFFVLDTAASPDLITERQLEASTYMEPFEIRAEYDNGWTEEVASGKTYVTPTFETDDYGTFLTAHAPIYDSQGRYSGFVGVDFDTQYYLNREARFRSIAIATLGVALLLALAIGYVVAVYQSAIGSRLQELYESSIRDSLTGMLNRRGAMHVIKKALEGHPGPSAMLLVDIDNLKMINDLRGHSTGDAVIARTSEAIRKSLRRGDESARLGDEFLIYAPDCDTDSAVAIAQAILKRLARHGMPLAGAPFSVSIGIAVHEGPGADFARMHRNADHALHQAKAEGRSPVVMFDPSAAAPLQPGHSPKVSV